jgi:hypothetical protein
MPGGRYARGTSAVGICERCSKKTLLNNLQYDGQFPDLKVCPDCWDPKHPQEYLPAVTDPTTLYDPTGDPDKVPAGQIVVSWPQLYPNNDLPLQIGITIGTVPTQGASFGSFDVQSFDVDSFSITSFQMV